MPRDSRMVLVPVHGSKSSKAVNLAHFLNGVPVHTGSGHGAPAGGTPFRVGWNYLLKSIIYGLVIGPIQYAFNPHAFTMFYKG